ncbi:sulfatase [Candidatus Pelagisphaera phototrophica]|uniref:sulfatase n=1 Tax=Candidatus Pelagisphaera phototrophica TaxID=2684113 RepID=UPI001A078679|nr:sulfatase [Candidatus Pelagisphaera phototrophica]QXD33762.1 sulfatase [Candidatus Pelagisphaera phototrophica]
MKAIFIFHFSLFILHFGALGAPNILFIAIDDMNDWTTLFDKSNPIQTPNIERLAARGMFFSKAYCNSPACNPSRASVLSGVRPSTSGVYGNNSDWKRALSDVTILPQHFKNHGYQTYASGKIFHHHGTEYHKYEAFDDFVEFPARQPDMPMPRNGNLNGIRSWTAPDGKKGPVSRNFDWGVYPRNPDDHIDNRTVDWAIEKIDANKSPFFIATGIFRPHMPFYAPQEWFDQYPLGRLTQPEIKEDDLEDLPDEAKALLHPPGRKFISTFEAEKLRDAYIFDKAIQGYQASASFADYQVGRLLDALDKSGKADNTIIVLWSDHGYHLGEKDHWEKFVLYEKATHIPYIIIAPGYKEGQICHRPVTLVDLYPTLTELCGLPAPEHLEGKSLVPLLKKPKSKWDPALITYQQGNHAVRSDRYRYIKYKNGDEELYDLEEDPNEWTNIAFRKGTAKIMKQHAAWLPTEDTEPIGPAR